MELLTHEISGEDTELEKGKKEQDERDLPPE
jgi:hypothetical protein